MSSKQTKAKVLRIGLFQNNRIIEERLLRTPGAVTIGSSMKRNTFVIPASNLPPTSTVFDIKGGQYVLYMTKGMTGRVRIGDQIATLQDLVQSGKAKKGPGGMHVLSLPQNAQGRVTVGEATLLFQFVTPPPPRPKPVLPASMRGGWIQGLDRILVSSTLITAVLFIGFVAFLEARDWPVQLENEQMINDRFVQLLMEEPEEIKIEEKEPVPMEEGEGDEPAEDADPEPAPKVEKPAPKVEEPKETSKPKSASEQAKLEADRKRRLAAEVQSKTILGQIGAVSADGSSGSLVDVLSDGAGKTSMDDAFDGSTGIATGVLGAEKNGMASSGSSGAEGTGGTVSGGDIGRSDGAKKAAGGVGTGGGKVEKKIKANVNIKGPTTTIGGKLDSNEISKKIKRRQGAIRKCYERQLKADPKAGGKVVVMFVIGSVGRVTSAKATANSVGGEAGSCVANVIKRIKFSRPKGGDVTVNKSFVFSSGG